MIRTATAADAAEIAAIYRPIVETTFISFEMEPPSAPEMAARIQAILKTHPWLVAEDGQGVAGYVYGSPHTPRAAYRWSANVSVYLAERARGRGLAKRLYAELFDILRRQGMHMAFAGIALPNAASVALHESMGFAPIGVYRHAGYKLGDWRDVGWWQFELQAPRPEPAEPIAFPDLGP